MKAKFDQYKERETRITAFQASGKTIAAGVKSMILKPINYNIGFKNKETMFARKYHWS
jgi:hypothetical protein